MKSGTHQFAQYFIYVLRRVWDDRLSQIAASLTFTTLLSLVPLLAIAFSIAAAFPALGDFNSMIRDFIGANLLPGTPASKVILGYMQRFSEEATQLTALGSATLAIAALLLLDTIGSAFDLIWRADLVVRHRSWARTLLLYAAILVVGPIVFSLSLSATSYLVGASMGITTGMPLAAQFVLKLSTVMVTVGGFCLLYLSLPNARVNTRHALIGGVTAGAMFEIMGRLFAIYIADFQNYTMVYGAFSVVPIFLLWIYFSWLVVLFGALISATLHVYRGAAA